LHDAPLVVALLRPRIREVQQQLVERRVRDLPLQHLHRIVADQSNVGQLAGVDAQQAVADAGSVDLDADEIGLRPGAREGEKRLAVADADLQHPRHRAAEHGIEVERRRRVVDAEARPELFECALLRARSASRTLHEALDGARGVLGHGFIES